MTALRPGGHWPDSAWPRRWRAHAQPEKLTPVLLTCQCKISFPEPIPAIGSALFCRAHGQVHVLESPAH
jgi:hypothetical protein